MFEGQFKGYQLKGFPFQADLDFSDDVFQKICVLKSNVRGKLQWLLSVSVSDEFLVPLPTLSPSWASSHLSIDLYCKGSSHPHPQGDRMVATDWVWVTACL